MGLFASQGVFSLGSMVYSVQQIAICKGVVAMKKKQFTIFALVIIAVGVAALILNRPYKSTSFVVDGDNWSATVIDGSSVLLDLNNDSNSESWSIASEPDTFVSDYHNILENIAEFHIIALNDGRGEMVFQCTKDNGSTTRYILALSISRHQKTHLQIDSISFNERA